jgi:hypothetical protein
LHSGSVLRVLRRYMLRKTVSIPNVWAHT